jgi:hypothetical protein
MRRSALGRLTFLLGLVLLVALVLRPALIVTSLISFCLGAAVVLCTPWFTGWLEKWAEKRGGLSSPYWCSRCRVGTANPLCWSCKQRDRSERYRPRGVAP